MPRTFCSVHCPVNSLELLLANLVMSLLTSPATCYLPSDQPQEKQNICSPTYPPSNAYRSSEALPSERSNKKDLVPKTSGLFHLPSSASMEDFSPSDEFPPYSNSKISSYPFSATC
ncbi:hypothetical protein ATANTOWER_004507, partial [Ataeniobius toweri]|nr:hypothetical protein [Ataeniobius toweri]